MNFDLSEEQQVIKIREVNNSTLTEQNYLGRFRGLITTGSLSLSYNGPDTYAYLYSVQASPGSGSGSGTGSGSGITALTCCSASASSWTSAGCSP